MNTEKYNNCLEQISKHLSIDFKKTKKVIDEKYKSDNIFRIQTQINIVTKK